MKRSSGPLATAELAYTCFLHHRGIGDFHGDRFQCFYREGQKATYAACKPLFLAVAEIIGDVKARNGQKFVFLAHPVETPWPKKWMALCQNVRRSVPYIFDCTSRR